jgi:MoxR-like ATPase
VILTPNNSRDLGDALKRRCLHLHIGYPDQALEQRIIEVRVPQIDERLRRQLVAFVQRLRTLELKKLPSVSETIDWARALLLLHVSDLEPEIVRTTLSLLLKYETDIVAANRQLETIVRDVVGRYGTFN